MKNISEIGSLGFGSEVYRSIKHLKYLIRVFGKIPFSLNFSPKLSANQIAAFYKFEYLEHDSIDFHNVCMVVQKKTITVINCVYVVGN